MDWVLASDFAARVRELRKVLGLTQATMASLLNVNPGQVSTWERGQQQPPQKNIQRWTEDQGWPLEIFQEGGGMPLDLVNVPVNDYSTKGCALVQDRKLRELLRAMLTKAAEEECSPDLKGMVVSFERELNAMQEGCVSL